MCEIRLLRADEIDVRAQQVKDKGAVLLLYKDARCDMAILDETFGMMYWQRRHEFKDGNNYCTVSVWNKDLNQWITKEDVGTESNVDKEKGQASDAFKRACFNIGIGRELYTAPFIWVNLTSDEVSKDTRTGRYSIQGVKFHVGHIEYTDKRAISELEIVDDKGNVRFRYRSPAASAEGSAKQQAKQPQQTPETKKKTFLRSSFDDAQYIDRILDWVWQNESKAAGNGKTFSLHGLIERHFNIDKEDINLLARIYDEYKKHKSQPAA